MWVSGVLSRGRLSADAVLAFYVHPGNFYRSIQQGASDGRGSAEGARRAGAWEVAGGFVDFEVCDEFAANHSAGDAGYSAAEVFWRDCGALVCAGDADGNVCYRVVHLSRE